jgi:hypothetical protein
MSVVQIACELAPSTSSTSAATSAFPKSTPTLSWFPPPTIDNLVMLRTARQSGPDWPKGGPPSEGLHGR